MRTSIGVLEEGDREGHEHEAADDEVGGNAVHAGQDGHQGPPEVELVLQLHLLALSQHQQVQPVICNHTALYISACILQFSGQSHHLRCTSKHGQQAHS